jgi:hypothetical protein
MKVGDYVEFATYHPASRRFSEHRRGIILKIHVRGNRRAYCITDGKQTFEYLGERQIRNILSSS